MISSRQYTHTGRPFRGVYGWHLSAKKLFFFFFNYFVYDHTQQKVTRLFCMQRTRRWQQKNTQPLIETAHLSLRSITISGPFGMCHKSIHFSGVNPIDSCGDLFGYK